MAAPVAPKTQAAGVSAAVAGAALYLLQVYVFKGSVPAGVESLIYTIVPGVVAFAAAYWAPHQVRPGDAPAPATVQATAALSAIPITPEQMAEIRDVLAHEQTAADERKMPPP
jgi:hypothetical protein